MLRYSRVKVDGGRQGNYRTLGDVGHSVMEYVNNKEVKIVIIFKSKLKLTRGLLVHLAVIIVFYKIFNCLNLNFITYLLKDPKQSVNR